MRGIRGIRAVGLGVLLGAIFVPAGIAATHYIISSLSQIKPSVRTALRPPGYYKVVYTPPRAGSASVSVRVPAGNYLATGSCTAMRSDPHGTPLTFGTAWSYLYAGSHVPDSPDATTSVTNTGTAPGPPFHDVPELGFANLSDSTGVALSHAGNITQKCQGDSGVFLGDLHVTAIPVSSLQGHAVGLGGPVVP